MSGPRPLTHRHEQTGSRHLDSIQDRVKETQERVNQCPFLVGVLISVAFEARVPKIVNHGLGTRATFIVVRENYDETANPGRFAEASDAEQARVDLDNQLAVVSLGDCRVDLWFYPLASVEVQ